MRLEKLSSDVLCLRCTTKDSSSRPIMRPLVQKRRKKCFCSGPGIAVVVQTSDVVCTTGAREKIKSVSSGLNVSDVLVGVHFMCWVVIYLLDGLIRSLNNLNKKNMGQNKERGPWERVPLPSPPLSSQLTGPSPQ